MDALTQLNNVFSERFSKLLSILPPGTADAPAAFFTYVIRFDNKGYRVFSLEELMRYFNQAKVVERVLFTIESKLAISSHRNTGDFLELFLDINEPTRCLLVTSSDNKDWTEASFAAVHEVLSKRKNHNKFARNPWTNLLIQILGVAFGFIISLWLASKVAPNFRIENSLVISLFFILLMFSNIWGYLNQALLQLIAKLFPNIEFIRPAKAGLHWLLQAFVATAAVTVVIYILGIASAFLSKVISEFV